MPAALLAAIATEIGLRTIRLRTLARILGVPLALDDQDPGRPSHPQELPADGAARYRAAQCLMQVWPFGGEGKCLRMSLVAGCLLRRHAPTVRLGIARLDQGIAAHAWIVVDGLIVDHDARLFIPLIPLAPPVAPHGA
jgi:hypothetical protein